MLPKSVDRFIAQAKRFLPETRREVLLQLQTGHGQMLRVVGLALGIGKGTSLRFPVDKTPEFGYTGWKRLTQATLLTVRKDSKIKGFPLTR